MPQLNIRVYDNYVNPIVSIISFSVFALIFGVTYIPLRKLKKSDDEHLNDDDFKPQNDHYDSIEPESYQPNSKEEMLSKNICS